LIQGGSGNTVQGDVIGADVTGTNPLGNGHAGVEIANGYSSVSSNNVVGDSFNFTTGAYTGQENIIAFNGSVGVAVDSGTGNTVLADLIFSNGALGIALASGANNNAPAPTLSPVMTSGGVSKITGTLQGAASTAYLIELFSSPTGTGGQGQTNLGFALVMTDSTGMATMSFQTSASLRGQFVTATATDPMGDTSAFSASVSEPTFTVTTTSDVSGSGVLTLREAIEMANAASGSTINFNIGAGSQTVVLTSPLPAVTNPLTIDATPPAGFPTQTIIINGPGTGFDITGGSSTINGNGHLAIDGFDTSGSSGIVLSGKGGNVVEGVFIGTNANSAAGLGNSVGITISSASNTIGGTAVGAGNLISGNINDGVDITGGATGNVIEGNIIGTNVAGTGALGNGGAGIEVSNGSNNVIGINSSAVGQENIIAFNGAAGVQIDAGSGNSVLGDSIFSNTGLGINLTSGANNNIPAPVISSVTTSGYYGFFTTIAGTLTATANTTYTIELFTSPTNAAGQGQTSIGFVAVTTNASGVGTINYQTGALAGGLFVTAMATDPSLNTSEFSNAMAT
jgi:hypothetical protein